MAYSLTPRQMALLRFIAGYQEAHGGVSPSFREMARAGPTRSTGGILDIVDDLEAGRAIRRLWNRARAIEVLTPVSIPRAPDGAPLYAVPGFWPPKKALGG